MANESQDDKILAQLYKEGAKESPPAKLNYEIINYAANADKPTSGSSQVGSHFGGGWKVPLSLAASVVVVFALLVQIDQSPQQLELPPIPDISIPNESKSLEETYPATEGMTDDTSTFKQNIKESDLDSQNRAKMDKTESRINQATELNSSISTTQGKSSTGGNNEQQQIYRERSNQERLLEEQSEKKKSSKNILLKDQSKSREESSPALNKPSTAKKHLETPIEEISESNQQAAPASATSPSTVDEEPEYKESNPDRTNSQETSGIAADSISENKIEEFAPIPVEDWLLMIEKLIARKDYAEAARQLNKFKQAHPKVNVEDLDAKIP